MREAGTPCLLLCTICERADSLLQKIARDDVGEQSQNAIWASVRECPVSPTGSLRPDRVTIDRRQK